MDRNIKLYNQEVYSNYRLISHKISQANSLEDLKELTKLPTIKQTNDLLKYLFRAFPRVVDTSPKEALETLKIYHEVCSEYPYWAISCAVKAFVRGEVEEFNAAFPPSIAILSKQIRKLLEPLMEKQQLIIRQQIEREKVLHELRDEKYRHEASQGNFTREEYNARFDPKKYRFEEWRFKRNYGTVFLREEFFGAN